MDDAHVVLCSRSARSRTPLVGRAQWDHCRRHPLALKKAECGLGILFGIEGDVEARLSECEAKEFAFAWAVFDQEDGGVRRHDRRGYQQGLCLARRGRGK